METEAKFLVPEKDIFDIFISAWNIGPFLLDAATQNRLEDTYLDTVDMAIMSNGYYLQRRQKEKGIVYTIRSLGGIRKNGVKHRKEMECLLEQDIPFEEWNYPDMKECLTGIVGKSELMPLFNVSHTRKVRNVFDKERHVAELILDDVLITAWEKKLEYLEIEVEMLSDGNGKDLEKLMSVLTKEYGLFPDPSSKFERALQLMEETEEETVPEEDMDFYPKPLSVQTLFEIHHVERAHAKKVTENALRLFDELKEVHGLGEEYRRVIWIAALVHDVGVYNDMEDHHKAGRDILMRSPPRELAHRFWPVAVWTTFLHKKK
jgi:exopolyphosphatase/guanosine-5'-triphosphate,3'-diphosphate pyrophosphatase